MCYQIVFILWTLCFYFLLFEVGRKINGFLAIDAPRLDDLISLFNDLFLLLPVLRGCCFPVFLLPSLLPLPLLLIIFAPLRSSTNSNWPVDLSGGADGVLFVSVPRSSAKDTLRSWLWLWLLLLDTLILTSPFVLLLRLRTRLRDRDLLGVRKEDELP